MEAKEGIPGTTYILKIWLLSRVCAGRNFGSSGNFVFCRESFTSLKSNGTEVVTLKWSNMPRWQLHASQLCTLGCAPLHLGACKEWCSFPPLIYWTWLAFKRRPVWVSTEASAILTDFIPYFYQLFYIRAWILLSSRPWPVVLPIPPFLILLCLHANWLWQVKKFRYMSAGLITIKYTDKFSLHIFPIQNSE